ncbi:carboxypeptidase-like regulatory domain-containing protein [candidate division KSB1 bacterium]
MKKLPRICLTAFLNILLILTFSVDIDVFAATTGKIQGTIIDAQSEEPLPGVNVVIEGTILGAASDESGFFFIINVPPGTYRLKASMVGYAAETKENVRVYVDRTTTVDFSLKTQAVAGEEVTVTADRVPVPLDVSSTEAYVSGEDIVESAVGRFDELMGMQAGVDLELDAKTGVGLSVRGGGISETDIKLDGLSMTNEISRIANTSISRNLIQDVQILTGGFNAEYGNIRSGIVNIVTKDGSFNRYSGVVEGIYSPSGYKHYGDFGPFDARDILTHYPMGGTDWDDTGITGMSSDAINGWGTDKRYNHNAFLAACESMNANGNLVYDPAAAKAYIDSHPYNNIFSGWTKMGSSNGYTAGTAADIYRWIHRPPEYGGNPDLTIDVGAGGPVPAFPRTKFYVSSYWNKSMYAFPSAREFSTEYTGTGKITHRIKSNMNLSANFMYNYTAALGGHGYNENVWFGSVVGDSPDYNGLYSGYYNESTTRPKFTDNYFGNLKFTHTYSPKTYWDLDIGVQRGFIKQDHIRDRDNTKIKFIDDPILAAAGWHEYNMETGVEYGYPAGRIGFDEIPRGFYLYFPEGSTVGVLTSNSMSPGSTDQLGNRIIQIQYQWTHMHNTTINIKGNIVSQVNKYNQIKAGFSFNYFHINNRAFRLDTQILEYHDEARTPETRKGFQTYKVDPRQFDAYIQNKLEWEGMIVNLGLRATLWDPNVKGFDLNETNMFSTVWVPYEQWGSVVGEGDWKWQNERTRNIKTKVLLQPRLGISHPITESSKIFFNYGHFYQRPDLWDMFLVCDQYYRGGGYLRGHIPVPDLAWPKTISYEIGYSQSIYDQILLQISGFYKDYTDESSFLQVTSYYENVNYYTHLTNHYRDVRGLEFRVERSFGRFVNFWANYNYMIQSSGNTGLERIYENELINRDQWFWNFTQDRIDPRPSFRFSLTLRTPAGFGPGSPILGIKPLAEWRFNWLTNWRDGGELQDPNTEGAAPSDWKYIQRINNHMHDIYITKRIARGASFYIRAKNILNIKYFVPGSPSIDYTTSLRLPWSNIKGDDKYGDYDKYWINTYPAGNDYSKWQRNKRDIFFGIRYQF